MDDGGPWEQRDGREGGGLGVVCACVRALRGGSLLVDPVEQRGLAVFRRAVAADGHGDLLHA